MVLTTFGQDSPKRQRQCHEIENNQPVYYQRMLEKMEFPLAWRNAAIENFDQWREAARAKVTETFQTLPPPGPFDPEIVASEKREGYTAHKIELNIHAYSRIPAYLLIPDGEGPFPALVALHDHGGEFYIGKEKMVRPFGVEPEVLDFAVEWVTGGYGAHFVGDEYAKAGYVVLAIDALMWGERGRKEGISYEGQQALASTLMQMGMNWKGIITFEDMRSVDFLASLPYVDASRIGCFGLSVGAHRTWMLSAMHDRIAAAVSVCWMNTTEVLMRPWNNQLKGGSAYSMLLPGLPNWLDYPDIASITCPRPLMVFNGSRDPLFPVDGVEAAYEIIREVYESQGAGEHFTGKLWDHPHIFPVDMQAEALAFFDKYLK